MKIRIERPTDPELRRQWDEAKRAVEAREQWPARHRERVQVMEKLLGGLPDDTTPTPSPVDDACKDRDVCGRCLGRHGMHFSWCSEQSADDDPMQCCPRFSWGDGFHDISCFRNRGALRLPQVVVGAAIARVTDDDCCVGDRSQCRCAPERGGWSDDDVEREKWIAVWNQTENGR